MSWAMQRAVDSVALPGHPLNGQGTFLPQTPLDGGLAWFAGATFETGDRLETAKLSSGNNEPSATKPASVADANESSTTTPRIATLTGLTNAGHRANFERLLSLHPPSAALLADQFKSGHVKSWRHVRCTTRDRLPLVGPLVAAELDKRVDPKNPTLWINTALGSRGLSLCVLAAELLAARLGGEPLPIPASLALCIDSRRK
jgi:tRNA 5-methylaminomethyl-2-thiouridine biosynthesis bifunctional protein